MKISNEKTAAKMLDEAQKKARARTVELHEIADAFLISVYARLRYEGEV